jgi:glycosyltransferase involved in cell wall biosynthesis
LYFGNDWSAENRTSSHHVARLLAERYRVFYLECPGLRAPKSSGRDLWKLLHKAARFLAGARPVQQNLKVRTLLQVPLHRFRFVRWVNRRFLLATVRCLAWREGITRPIAWFTVPHPAPVVGRLDEILSVYYCIDDYSALPDVNPEAVRALDQELTRNASLVFVASETLLDDKRLLNPNTRVSPHGVDLEHFGQALRPDLPVPEETAHLRRPVVGFFGLIEQWIDLELIDYLAAQRPDWNFVMIGRVAVPEERVPRRPNIHFLGKRPYESLPAYGKQFDAAIIPSRLNQFTLHANPLKLREYLALGKPIVSVSTPQIDKFSDVVAIARTREEFLAKLDDVLTKPPSMVDVERRLKRVASMSWRSRVGEVLDVVEEALGRATRSQEIRAAPTARVG